MTIERDDFNRLEDRLTEAMARGFSGINTRLDTLNGRTRRNESAIAVLQDRGRADRKLSAAWGGFIGGALMIGAWIAERLWK